jgi:serine/threonine protein kinase
MQTMRDPPSLVLSFAYGQTEAEHDAHDDGIPQRKKEKSHMADRVGQQFGNYRLIQLLGSGGFAEVYLAEHRQLGMKAAIKVLYAHLERSEASTFRQEARTIADLKHPHIIRVLDFDVQNGTPFLVLDYASKGSLRALHPRGERLSLDLVVTYVQQIASALQYAHEHKLIHRDVKPENILIGEDGQLLLSDFGIATIAHSTSSMNTEAMMGTLAYMAPEQIQGKPRAQSDQYALAVTVYQWLTGNLPFVGSSAEIIAQHLGAPPPPMRALVSDLPMGVEQVVLTALAKDPQQRFGSVQAFAHALTKAFGQAEVAPPLSQVPPIRTPEPTSDATTQQSSLAVTAAGANLSSTPPAHPALTPLASVSLAPSVKQERSPGTSSPRHWTTMLSGLVLLMVVIGGGLWFARPIQPAQGNGTSSSPYRLSASTTDTQHIGITRIVSGSYPSGATCPLPTIVSLQDDGSQTVINFSWQGLDNAQHYYWNGAFDGPDPIQAVLPASGSSIYQVVYAAAPQAGQQWYLELSQSLQWTGISCSYDDFYLQF